MFIRLDEDTDASSDVYEVQPIHQSVPLLLVSVSAAGIAAVATNAYSYFAVVTGGDDKSHGHDVQFYYQKDFLEMLSVSP